MSQPRSARRRGANAVAHLKPELVVEPSGYERARDLPKLLPLWEWDSRRRAKPTTRACSRD